MRRAINIVGRLAIRVYYHDVNEINIIQDGHISHDIFKNIMHFS